jgi:hypothetical protein
MLRGGERREMRGEDYRGKGGGVGRKLLASFLGMRDIINVMGRGLEEGDDLGTYSRQTLIW